MADPYNQFVPDRVNVAHTNMLTESDNDLKHIDVMSSPFKRDDFDGIFNSWIQYQQIKFTIPFISNLLLMANDGAASDQAAMFQTLLDKEPIISAHLQTRKLSVLATPWSIMGDNSYKCQELTNILVSAGINNLMAHLLDDKAFGYAGSTIDWGVGMRSIDGFTKINHTNWTFDRAGGVAVILRNGQQIVLTEDNKHLFVFSQYQLRSGIPSQGGILRPLVWTYFFKHIITKEQVRYLEKFGMPLLLAKVTQADFNNSTVRSKLKGELRSLGAEGVGIIANEMNLEPLQVPNAAGGNADYLRYINYCDDQYAIAILGQTASSGDSGGMSKGQVQENVRKDIVKADCEAITEVINNQVLRLLEYAKYGTNDCSFIMDSEEKQSLKDQAAIIATLNQAGYKVKPSYIEETFKLPLETQSAIPIAPAPVAGLSALAGTAGASPTPQPEEQSTPIAPQGSPLPMNDFHNYMSKKKFISLVDLDNKFRDAITGNIQDSNLPDDIKADLERNDLNSVDYLQHINDAAVGLAIENPEYADELSTLRQSTNSIDMAGIVNDVAGEERIPVQQPIYNIPNESTTEEEAGQVSQQAVQPQYAIDEEAENNKKTIASIAPEVQTLMEDEARAIEPKTQIQAIQDAIGSDAKDKMSDNERLEYAAKKYGINIHASTALTRGWAKEKLDTKLGNSLILGQGLTPEEQKDYKLLYDAIQANEEKALGNSWWITRQVSAAAEMLPSLMFQLGYTAIGAGAGAVIGGGGAGASGAAIGSVAPGVGTAAVGGASALIGGVVTGGIGGAIGASQYLFRNSVGASYASMVFDQGLDPQTSLNAAELAAIPNTLMGIAKFSSIVKAIPGGSKLLESIVDKNIQKVISSAVVKDLGKETALNLTTNLAQQAVNNTVNEYVKSVTADINGSAYSSDIKQQLNSIVTGTFEAFIPQVLLAGAGSAAMYTLRRPNATLKEKQQAMKELQNISEVAKDIQENVNDIATQEGLKKPSVSMETSDGKTMPVDITNERGTIASDALSKYLQDNPNARINGKIELVNGDDNRLVSANGQKATGIFDTDNNTVVINADAIKTPEQLTNLLAHEDFAHRFLESTLSQQEADKAYDTLNKLIDKGDTSFWNNNKQSWYERYYSNPEYKLSPEEIKRQINSEKLASFIENGGYVKLDTASKEYQPIARLVAWIKNTFNNVLGKATDEQVLAILSNAFKQYRQDTESRTQGLTKSAPILSRIDAIAQNGLDAYNKTMNRINGYLNGSELTGENKLVVKELKNSIVNLPVIIDNLKKNLADMSTQRDIDLASNSVQEYLNNLEAIRSKYYTNNVNINRIFPREIANNLTQMLNINDEVYREYRTAVLESKSKLPNLSEDAKSAINNELTLLNKRSPSVKSILGMPKAVSNIVLNMKEYWNLLSKEAQKSSQSTARNISEILDRLHKQMNLLIAFEPNFLDRQVLSQAMDGAFNKASQKVLKYQWKDNNTFIEKAYPIFQNEFDRVLNNEKLANTVMLTIQDLTKKLVESQKIGGSVSRDNIVYLMNGLDEQLDIALKDQLLGNKDLAQSIHNSAQEYLIAQLSKKNIDWNILPTKLSEHVANAIDKASAKQQGELVSQYAQSVQKSGLTTKDVYEFANGEDSWGKLSDKERQQWENENLKYSNIVNAQNDIQDMQRRINTMQEQLKLEQYARSVQDIEIPSLNERQLIASISSLQEKVNATRTSLNETVGASTTIGGIIGFVDAIPSKDVRDALKNMLNKDNLKYISTADFKSKASAIFRGFDKMSSADKVDAMSKAMELIADAKKENANAYQKQLGKTLSILVAQAKDLVTDPQRMAFWDENVASRLQDWVKQFDAITSEEQSKIDNAKLHAGLIEEYQLNEQNNEYIRKDGQPVISTDVDFLKANGMELSLDEIGLLVKGAIANIDKKYNKLSPQISQNLIDSFNSIITTGRTWAEIHKQEEQARILQLKTSTKDNLVSVNDMMSSKKINLEDIPATSNHADTNTMWQTIKKYGASALRKYDVLYLLGGAKEDSAVIKNLWEPVWNAIQKHQEYIEKLKMWSGLINGDMMIDKKLQVRNIQFEIDKNATHKQTPKLDANGKVVNDANGNPIMQFVYDDANRPVYESKNPDNYQTKLSLNQMLHIYCNAKSESGFKELWSSSIDCVKYDKDGKVIAKENIRLTPDFIKSIEAALESKEYLPYKEAADKQMNYYRDNQYKDIDEVFFRVKGYHMTQENNYFPQLNLDRTASGVCGDDAIPSTYMLDKARRRVASGMTLERDPRNPNVGFKEFDYMGTVVKNAQQVAQYIAFTEVVKDVNSILSDKATRELMDKILPGSGESLYNKWIYALANERRVNQNEPLDILTSKLRNVFTVATLGLRIIPILVQIPYGLFSRSETPISYTMSGLSKLTTGWINDAGPLDIVKSVEDKSTFMRMRYKEAIRRAFSPFDQQSSVGWDEFFNGKSWSQNEFMDFMDKVKQGNIKGAWDAGTRAVFAPIAFMEQMMSASAWDSHYQYLKDSFPSMSEADRIKRCDKIIFNTQPFYDIRTNSEFSNTNWFRILSMFKGAQAQFTSHVLTQAYGVIMDAKSNPNVDASFAKKIGYAMTQEHAKSLGKLVAMVMVGSLIEQMIRSGLTNNVKNEPLEYAKSVSDNLLGGSIVFGNVSDQLWDALINAQHASSGTEKERFSALSKDNNVLNKYVDIAVNLIKNPNQAKSWEKVLRATLPAATFLDAYKNRNYISMMMNSGSTTDKGRALEAMFMSDYALNIQRDYPLSAVLEQPYRQIDYLIKDYNKAHPQQAFWPSPIESMWDIKGTQIFLSSNELSQYKQLINNYVRDAGIDVLTTLDYGGLETIKGILQRAKRYAKQTLLHDPVFVENHHAEFEKINTTLEQ